MITKNRRNCSAIQPNEKLHVNGGTANVVANFESTDARAYISFKDNSTTNTDTVFLGAEGNDMTFYAGSASTKRLTIDSAGNATFAGNVTVTSNLQTNTFSTSSYGVFGGVVQLQSNLDILNKAQTAYINLATRDTSGSEVVYNLSNIGTGTFAGSIQSKATQSASTWIQGNGGGLNYGMDLFLTNDLGSTQGATRLRSAYGDIGTAGSPNFSISRSTTTQAYNSNPNTLTYSESLVIDGSNGNVGIGNTNPSNPLTLYKNASQGNPSSHTPANASLKIEDNANTMYLDGNSIVATGTAAFTMGNTAAADFIVYTDATERMRIDSSGNVRNWYDFT